MLFAVSKLVGALVRLESWLVLLALAAAWAALCGRRRLAAGLAVLLAALIAAFAVLLARGQAPRRRSGGLLEESTGVSRPTHNM
ncbi:MAG: hypothetical protein D6832_06535, partial [Alphaproteobacteria bacterium]